LLQRSETFWNLPTNATQIRCIFFCCAAKFLEFPTKATQINYQQKQPIIWILFCRTAKIWNIYVGKSKEFRCAAEQNITNWRYIRWHGTVLSAHTPSHPRID
jgi:hypothetical protein